MDIAALRALIAVAETGSFSRAAEQLFMTQPAISKRIAALESELDVVLIDRLGRNTRLTEAGETLLVSAHRIVAEIANSREQVRALKHEVGGRLRLATSHHIGIHRLPPILKAYTQACPAVDLDLMFMDSEQASDQVANGAIELAIVTLPESPPENIESRLVWNDPLVIVCAPEHPLNKMGKSDKKKRPLTANHLAQYPAVLPARGTVTRSILFDAIAHHDITINTALETNYLETIKMMVSVGLGWSALPSNMVDEAIVAIPINGLTMNRELGSMSLRGRTLSRAAVALLELLPNA